MSKNIVNIADMRMAAKSRLPRMVFDYLDGAALDEVTMRENLTDFESLRLRQRVLQDVSQSQLEAIVLGQHVALPVMISPMGALTLFHPDADIALARAAARAGTIFVHSAWSGVSLEEVVSVAPHSTWAQIAFWRDKGITRDHVDRAAASDIDVLVVAGDVGVSSKRERDLHHKFDYSARPRLHDMLEAATHPRWLARLALGRKVTYGNYQIDGRRMRLNEMGPFMHENENSQATWEDVEELRSRWPGRIVIKGVMTSDDTLLALKTGVDAVMVSNHGGRQFDAQPSTIASLPEVVSAADGKLEVFMDGGIRRGSDIVKCLALGAKACFIGRPVAYGLAAAGSPGVDQVFDLLREELQVALGFVGVSNIDQLDKSVIKNSLNTKD